MGGGEWVSRIPLTFFLKYPISPLIVPSHIPEVPVEYPHISFFKYPADP